MTGNSINAQQSQEFLSTMHTMIDDLDTISSNIDDHTYLRLANGLQRLYNIHNSTIQSSNSVRETWVREQRQILNEENNIAQNITTALARHYGRVYDSSGILIHNDIATINDHAYPVNAHANDYINANYDSWNENNPVQNRDSARISYTSVTSNHWIEAALREGLRSAR
jgi:hypothetical protein